MEIDGFYAIHLPEKPSDIGPNPSICPCDCLGKSMDLVHRNLPRERRLQGADGLIPKSRVSPCLAKQRDDFWLYQNRGAFPIAVLVFVGFPGKLKKKSSL